MTDKGTVEVSSFLEVPADAVVKVNQNGTVYNIGFVQRIHATSNEYVVWEDNEGRIWYETSNRDIVKLEEFHTFWNRYQLTSCRSTHNLDEKSKYSYARMQSSAIASALEGQFTAATEALKSAAVFIKTANERISRRRYTTGAVIALLIFLSVSGVLRYVFKDPNSLFFLAHISMLGGSLGAVLSALAARKGGLGFDPNASESEGILNGAIRVVYGVISAFAAVLVIKTGVISTPLITPDNQPLSLIAVAIAGGFAERWAADMIQRFSSEAKPKLERPSEQTNESESSIQ